MALPEDKEARLQCFRNALENWNFQGYVRFNPLAQEWLLRELSGCPLKEVARELHRFVQAGGTIDEQQERRSEFIHYEFHYDLRVRLRGRYVYFETVLLCEDPDDPDDPMIEVVSVHDV